MVTAICYKTKEPVYYNKGTKNEKTCDHFLSYLTWKDEKAAQEEVDKLNAEKPNTLWNGIKVDWNTVDHFFVNIQEGFY